jgi:hypothetical protein
MQLLSLIILARQATSSHRINSWSIPLQHSDNLACLLLQQKAESLDSREEEESTGERIIIIAAAL